MKSKATLAVTLICTTIISTGCVNNSNPESNYNEIIKLNEDLAFK